MKEDGWTETEKDSTWVKDGKPGRSGARIYYYGTDGY